MSKTSGLFSLGRLSLDELQAVSAGRSKGTPYWVTPENKALLEALAGVCRRNKVTPIFETDGTTLWTLATLALALVVKHEEARPRKRPGRPPGTHKYEVDDEAIAEIWRRTLKNPKKSQSSILKSVVNDFQVEGRWGNQEFQSVDPHRKRLRARLKAGMSNSVLSKLLRGD
ncbi:hypothetical protein [Alsobacter sp. R-9]